MTKGTRARVRSRWPIAALVVCAVIGYIFVASGVSAGGSDLRPAGGDVSSLIEDRSQRIGEQRETALELQRQIDRLSLTDDDQGSKDRQERIDKLKDRTGLSEVAGPGVRVTLTDAPRSVDIPGLDPNVLVVHQQDLQGFVNALWAGGAEAVTLQGQRLIATTGIKCVGNTVVLDGVPYAPPYVIEAVGDVFALNYSLNTSPEVNTYADYAERYELGLAIKTLDRVTAAAWSGTVGLKFAAAAG